MGASASARVATDDSYTAADEDAGLLDREWRELRNADGRIGALQRIQLPRLDEQV